jgi:isopenicillin N synthase-like dioxygenase
MHAARPLPRCRHARARCSATSAGAFTDIPVLDVSRLRGSPAERAAFLPALRHAAHVTGFFYAAGHCVPAPACDAALAAAATFFALPADAKRALDNSRSPAFRGYIAAGAENTAGAPDWREQARVCPSAACVRFGCVRLTACSAVGPRPRAACAAARRAAAVPAAARAQPVARARRVQP